MKSAHRLLAFSTALVITFCLSGCVSEHPPEWLWAKVRVTQLAHFEGAPNDIRLMFSISNNDPYRAKKSHIETSKLYIDGYEVEGSTEIINTGDRDRFWSELPPQTTIFFDREIRGFSTPGIHTIVWKSEVFESTPARFSVISPPHH